MSNNTEKQRENSLQALYEELENRYGPGLAQEIVDQIRKTEDQDYVPDYMPVKAISEVLELFRKETRDLLQSLKQRKAQAQESNVLDMESKRIEVRLQRLLPVYWMVMKTFYTLYARVINAPEIPAYERRLRCQPEQARAA